MDKWKKKLRRFGRSALEMVIGAFVVAVIAGVATFGYLYALACLLGATCADIAELFYAYFQRD